MIKDGKYMKYVSDLIKLEDIEQWTNNDAILIK